MVPTKETHRYVGMWRPPWESLWGEFTRQRNLEIDQHRDPPYAQIPNCFESHGRLYNALKDVEKFRSDYLAGHFDEPVYELKKSAEEPAPE